MSKLQGLQSPAAVIPIAKGPGSEPKKRLHSSSAQIVRPEKCSLECHWQSEQRHVIISVVSEFTCPQSFASMPQELSHSSERSITLQPLAGPPTIAFRFRVTMYRANMRSFAATMAFNIN